MDKVLLKYPKKSHRKLIKLPRESARLAELMGAEFGDGGIGNPWQMIITLNADKDAEYALYIEKMINKLFGLDIVFRKRGERALQLISTSMSLVDFLVKKGAVRGNKIKKNFDIPDWIRRNDKYEKLFVRGLVDTDGCLYVHHHIVGGVTYKNIGFCFVSFSKNIIHSVSDIFRKFAIEPHINKKENQINLYKEESIIKYLSIFGSSNPRITNIYKEWRGARVV
ncbi:MAG: hypothetical protein WC467_03170 [Patescibacteria group bacterium]